MGAPSRIALIGFMGSGKSTVGQQLARNLGFHFVDLDSEIENLEGCSIADIFASKGEAHFRQLEHRVLKQLIIEEKIVAACGGGVVEQDINRRILADNFFVVFLDVDFETAWRRISQDKSRPKAAEGLEAAKELYMRRKELYKNTADATIKVSGKNPAEIVNTIIEDWKRSART